MTTTGEAIRNAGQFRGGDKEVRRTLQKSVKVESQVCTGGRNLAGMYRFNIAQIIANVPYRRVPGRWRGWQRLGSMQTERG